jgi:hypothetical protein
MVHGDGLAVAVGEFAVALVDGGRSVLGTGRGVALAGERAAHELGPWRTAGDFATVFEFVTFADGGIHVVHCWVLNFGIYVTSNDWDVFLTRSITSTPNLLFTAINLRLLLKAVPYIPPPYTSLLIKVIFYPIR